MNVKVLRMAGFFGVAAPLLGFTMIFLAIRASPWFSWTGNALSDLGVEGFGAVIFNSGLLMTGALMMMFSLGLYELTRSSRVGRLGFGLFLAGSFLLCGIGSFPETAGRIHRYVSVAFFVSLPLALFALGTFLARRRMKRSGLLSFAAASSAAGVWLIPWSAVAIPEALSALAVGVWSSALGLWMMKGEKPD
ncbi:MAG: DUF998 domain-containing protein [Candidatus Bathyarchaeia archaeon]